jgi:hypothetical protein
MTVIFSSFLLLLVWWGECLRWSLLGGVVLALVLICSWPWPWSSSSFLLGGVVRLSYCLVLCALSLGPCTCPCPLPFLICPFFVLVTAFSLCLSCLNLFLVFRSVLNLVFCLLSLFLAPSVFALSSFFSILSLVGLASSPSLFSFLLSFCFVLSCLLRLPCLCLGVSTIFLLSELFALKTFFFGQLWL